VRALIKGQIILDAGRLQAESKGTRRAFFSAAAESSPELGLVTREHPAGRIIKIPRDDQSIAFDAPRGRTLPIWQDSPSDKSEP